MSIPQISKLTERIERSDPKDLHEQAAILDDLVELRDLLQRVSSNDLAGCLDAAVTLMRHLPQVAPGAAGEVQGIVGRLISLVSAAMPSINPAAAPSAPQPQEKHVVRKGGAHRDLRLINDMLLGEIMLQLGTVTREKIDAAMKTQQVTGMRFGEAMVHLGAASWEDVENGLKLQEHLTRATSHVLPDNGSVGSAAPDGSPSPAPVPAGAPSNQDSPLELGRPPIAAFGNDHLNVIADVTLGEEMIRLGTITREQLEGALKVQAATGIRIGEALVEVGAANWDQVAEGVRMQELRRESRGNPGGAWTGREL